MMMKSWYWGLLLLLIPHLAFAQTDILGNPITSASTPLSINPSFTTLYAGEEENFSASGGSGQYTWETSQGRLSKTQGSYVMYSAPRCADGCETFVTVSDEYGNSQTAQIKIIPGKLPLLITPETVDSLPSGRMYPFKVTNAEGPISWTTTGGDITEQGIYIAPYTEGKYEIYATEIYSSRQAIAYVTVDNSIQISPKQVILPPEGKKQFQLSGANSNVQWTTTAGYIDADGNYKAPKAIGSYEVVVYFDTAGNHRTAYVEVADVPVITPANSSVCLGDEVTLSVDGGISPYHWSATENLCSIINNNSQRNPVTYRCSQSGEMSITVTDNIGQNTEAKINVCQPLKPAPANLYLIPGQTEKVGIIGGTPPYTWRADKGEIEEDKKSGEKVYSAPPILGEDVITITDATNVSVDIKVHIFMPLSVTPQELLLKPEQTETVLVVTGNPSYSATATKGVIQQTFKGNEFSYIASSEEGEDVITICDQVFTDNGKQRCQSVNVYVKRAMSLANLPKLVEINSQHDLTVIGGSGGYFGVATQGKIEINPNTGQGSYIAPDISIQDTITITDSSGNQEVRTIEVVGYMPPVISPTTISLAPGEPYIFEVNRGDPPYRWSFQGSVVNPIDERHVQITAPTQTGQYLLTVTDGKTGMSLANGKQSGKPATAMITVTQTLKLTPQSPIVYRGEFAKVRINKLVHCQGSIEG